MNRSNCAAACANSPRAKSLRTSWSGTKLRNFRWKSCPSWPRWACSASFSPKKYGGAGLGYIEYAIAIEELSRVDGSVGIIVAAHNSLCSNHIYKFGTEEQKKKYLVPLAQGKKIGAGR